MASCPSCGADGAPTNAPCPRCGASASRPESALPTLELDMPVRRAAKPAPPKKKIEEEVSLELAIDPRSLIQSIDPEPPSSIPASGAVRQVATTSRPPVAASRSLAPTKDVALARRAQESMRPAVHDLAFDARLLAEYGDPPANWVMLPFYAWRVLRRQRELKQALAGRREEVARTMTELEDSLVAFAERVRPTAERQGPYAPMLDEVKRAEEALRSRDRVLAADQDAQTGRLASVDAQLSKFEAELAKAQAEERTVLVEIASAQGALSRAEAKAKRADTELRAARREPDRST
ncbi:MAG: hypothetical protein ACLP1X_04785 [Polyangiaceae bacterium]